MRFARARRTFAASPDGATALENERIAPLVAGLAERYLIERELGSGGMATVYLALDLKHQRHVAIKVLDSAIAASEYSMGER